MANKVKTISFRVDETTYNKYSELAARSKRKLGDYIRLLLEETVYLNTPSHEHNSPRASKRIGIYVQIYLVICYSMFTNNTMVLQFISI